MIFKSKDLIEKIKYKDYVGFEILNNAFYLKCEDQSPKNKLDSWEWKCKLFYIKKQIDPSKQYDSISEFEVESPWTKEKMLIALDKTMNESGKQKLIRAVYDFQ